MMANGCMCLRAGRSTYTDVDRFECCGGLLRTLPSMARCTRVHFPVRLREAQHPSVIIRLHHGHSMPVSVAATRRDSTRSNRRNVSPLAPTLRTTIPAPDCSRCLLSTVPELPTRTSTSAFGAATHPLAAGRRSAHPVLAVAAASRSTVPSAVEHTRDEQYCAETATATTTLTTMTSGDEEPSTYTAIDSGLNPPVLRRKVMCWLA